jgi:hypothetical protein
MAAGLPASTATSEGAGAGSDRSGTQAKDVADRLARRVIEWSAAARPTSLRHDAAEAILAGLWGVKELGWLDLSLDEILRT